MGKEGLFIMPEGNGPGGADSEINKEAFIGPRPGEKEPGAAPDISGTKLFEENSNTESPNPTPGDGITDGAHYGGTPPDENATSSPFRSPHERSAGKQAINIPDEPLLPSPDEAQGQPHAQSSGETAGPIQEHVEGEEPEVPETRLEDKPPEQIEQETREKITKITQQTQARQDALRRLADEDATVEEREAAAREVAALGEAIKKEAKVNSEFRESNWEILQKKGKQATTLILVLSVLYTLALLYTTRTLSKSGG